MDNVRDSIIHSDSSRRVTYKDLNPNFVVHEIYRTKHTIVGKHRLSFTRFRVSGHSLMCETGRWNRRGRGRLPLEDRLPVWRNSNRKTYSRGLCDDSSSYKYT